MKKTWLILPFGLCMIFLILLYGCAANNTENKSALVDTQLTNDAQSAKESETAASNQHDSQQHIATGFINEQVLDGTTGAIHYSYYLPDGYDASRKYPLVMTMPGYDMMWFGEESSGSNLNWRGFISWTELDEDLIVVSAQLTDWDETSAQQVIELTKYFIEHFAVDPSRVYGAGYSAGGETMSRAVTMRPDLYTAYLHGASQWDGEFDPIAENSVAVYIFIAENDEYYGSQQAQETYNKLYQAYQKAGYNSQQIDNVLQLEIPDDTYFNRFGIYSNYHGGGNILFEDQSILNWILSHSK